MSNIRNKVEFKHMIWYCSRLYSNFTTGKHIWNVCFYFTDSDPVPIVLKMGRSDNWSDNWFSSSHDLLLFSVFLNASFHHISGKHFVGKSFLLMYSVTYFLKMQFCGRNMKKKIIIISSLYYEFFWLQRERYYTLWKYSIYSYGTLNFHQTKLCAV